MDICSTEPSSFSMGIILSFKSSPKQMVMMMREKISPISVVRSKLVEPSPCAAKVFHLFTASIDFYRMILVIETSFSL